MKFSDYNFNAKVDKGLSLLGFKRPTDIQYKSIPNILKGEDLLAIAQTGTGKTGAYAIPIVDIIYKKKINKRRSGYTTCLVMTPTHELALQVNGVFQKIAKYTTLKTMAIIGGVDQQPQIDELKRNVDIVVATPGRMFDLISQGYLKTQHIEILILDEADYMLDLGFIKDIQDLVRKLPKRRQTLFFSATINDKIKKTAYALVKQNAIRIQLSPKDPVANKIEHFVLFVDMDHKRHFLERVVAENPNTKILVFVRTKVRAERVSKAMARVDIKSLTIHSNKNQEERSAVLKEFREGDADLLIATDITARGIDIPSIEIVINYDLPEQAENYVHRVGRTGRNKNKGYAYSFCSKNEKEILDIIQSYLEKEITVLEFDKMSYLETLNIQQERTHDYMALIAQNEDFLKKKKRKKKK